MTKNTGNEKMIHPEIMDTYFRPYIEKYREIYETKLMTMSESEIYAYYTKTLYELGGGKDTFAANGLIMAPFDHLQSQCDQMENMEFFMSAMLMHPMYDMLHKLLSTEFGKKSADDFQSNIYTAVVAWAMRQAVKSHGDRSYSVASDLAWALDNTSLKGYPASDLRLPVPAIFIEMPGNFRVWNDVTGWHRCSGVYLSEYETVRGGGNRCWKVVLIGESKSENILDDAISYYTIMLKEGQDAKTSAMDAVYIGKAEHEVARQNLDGAYRGWQQESVVMEKKEELQGTIRLNEMDKEFLKIYSFIMNLVIYVTRPDVDTVVGDASPEFEALRARMMKAKGKKRDRLKNRLKSMIRRPRIKLGTKFTVKRLGSSEATGDGSSRTVQVRHTVGGHHKRVGKEQKQIWVQPYQRGPEYAPLTTSTKVKVK